jgi:glycosyltransferase involved in cell wall biosynthesis
MRGFNRAVSRRRGPVLLSWIAATSYRMEPAARRHGMLYVGRITKHKNLSTLVEVFEELCRRGHRESLTIAGDGPAFETLRQTVERSPQQGSNFLVW